MALKVLQFIWRWKSWLLVGVLAIIIGIQHYAHKKGIAKIEEEKIKLEAIIGSTGVDLQTCKGNLALCETQFKNLSKQCRLKCPDMANDINEIESDYEASKKDLLKKQEEIKGLLQEIEKIRQEKLDAGEIVWAEDVTGVVAQLKKVLGDKWGEVLEKLKKDSGIQTIENEISGITTVVKRFRWYPKAKLGVGHNLTEFQGNVGVSLFSYGKLKAVDSTMLDFIEMYVGIGMDSNTVKFGFAPISLNLGSFLPVIKDLDLTAGYQIDTNAARTIMIGVTSTF